MNETDAAARNATLEQILFKWSGSDTVASTSRGRYIDAVNDGMWREVL